MTNKHSPRQSIIGNKPHMYCDHCNERFESHTMTIINNAKGQFAYCEKCTKELYPNYKKIYVQNYNENLVKSMRDALARKEYRR